MAKIFLDTNYLIDAIHRHPENIILESLENNIIYISPLSVHIYCYIFKIKIPNEILQLQLSKFQMVELSTDIITRAISGPSSDIEDNIQLHSGIDAGCDIFLTADNKLLNARFFGKMRLQKSI